MIAGRRWPGQRNLSIATWMTTIFILVVLLGVAAIQWTLRYQEDTSVREMAETQARRTAELVFQNLYSVMSRGWTREDLQDIIDRTNAVEPEIKISVYRSAAVASQFGDLADARRARNNDSLVAGVFSSGTEALARDEDSIRFVYPLVTNDSCGDCHTGSTAGTVNGVIDMQFPVSELRVPLRFTLRLALYGLVATLGLLFVGVFLQMRYLIVRPIINLAGVISTITTSNDMGGRVVTGRLWPRELRQLAKGFNSLMQEVEESRVELVEQSLRDPLTGLFNRRRFDAALARELDRANRYQNPLSVLLIDLDGFKQVNDTHGHAAGDRVLVHVANLLRANVRGTDIVARTGGDEFAILLPESNAAAAKGVAAKLTEAIDEDVIRWGDETLAIGASIGIASCGDTDTTSAALLAEADARMYAAKARRKAVKADAAARP